MIAGKRVGLTPDEDTRKKLVRLAVACGKHPTTMALDLVKLCLNTPNIIDHVQRINNADERYRVRYRVEGNAVIYD